MNKLTLVECSKRRLDDTYIVVYAIKNEINIKKGDYIEKSNIYTLIGIDIKGYRQFLNIYQDKIVLVSQFGLGDTMLLCGFKDALEKYYNAPVHFIIKPTHQVVMNMYGIPSMLM